MITKTWEKGATLLSWALVQVPRMPFVLPVNQEKIRDLNVGRISTCANHLQRLKPSDYLMLDQSTPTLESSVWSNRDGIEEVLSSGSLGLPL